MRRPITLPQTETRSWGWTVSNRHIHWVLLTATHELFARHISKIPLTVPLVQRAYELWQALEKRSNRKLLLQTGGLMIGQENGALVTGALRSARAHKLSHQVLSASDLHQRYPMFQTDARTVAVWEPRAGVLFPELIIQTHLELAAEHGASLKFNEPVLRWEADGDGVRVMTSTNTYRANRLLIAAGAWLSSLLNPSCETANETMKLNKPNAGVTLPLSIERQVLFWFEPASQTEQFQPEVFPIYIWEYQTGRFFYGFPDLGEGVKVAFHHQGECSDPDHVCRKVATEEIDKMHLLLRRCLPLAAGRLRSDAVCIYTNTPDEHFIFDWHPEYSQVLVASPCSGHGFKFSSAIGELAANLLTGRKVLFDLRRFEIARFDEA